MIWIASRSSNTRFALNEGTLLAVGLTYQVAAAAARKHTLTTDEPTWVYQLEVQRLGAYKVEKQVIFAPQQESAD